ncbi:MAG: hypothetical protein K8S20_17370 [Chloroflexi bacterium]|nr:hypothetical protein [Chloroflexota bacterium]
MTELHELSSLEKLLLGIDQPDRRDFSEPLHQNMPCPQCRLGILEYNGLLQLECPACGFVNAEGGGCT